MVLCGIGDEAGDALDRQIAAVRELGWKHLELRNVQVAEFAKANLHDLHPEAFDILLRMLDAASLNVACVASNVLKNGSPLDPWAPRLEQLTRCLERTRRLGAPLIRIMSFEPGPEEYRIPAEAFRRVREVVDRCLDADVQPVHENCRNYGGMGWQHALELLDKCPGLKWAFDTGNPLANFDRSRAKPWPRQSSWEFWEHVRDHVAHIHVKDGRWNTDAKSMKHTWPGEGQGRVAEILQDARKRGYHGFISIEPAMVRSKPMEPGSEPEPDAPAKFEKEKFSKFVDYGKALAQMAH